MEQLKLFDDGYQPKQDRLYEIIRDELIVNDQFSDSDAHLAATDIAQKIRNEKLACNCGGNCGCER